MRTKLIFVGGAIAVLLLAQTVGLQPHTTLMPKSDGSSTNELRFRELASNGQNYVAFKAPSVLPTNYVWELPSTNGSSAEVLTNSGSGQLYWSTIPTPAPTPLPPFPMYTNWMLYSKPFTSDRIHELWDNFTVYHHTSGIQIVMLNFQCVSDDTIVIDLLVRAFDSSLRTLVSGLSCNDGGGSATVPAIPFENNLLKQHERIIQNVASAGTSATKLLVTMEYKLP